MYCCTVTVVPHIGLFFSRELCCVHLDSKQFASSNLRVELALVASVVLSERVVSENSPISYSWRVFELGRVVSLMTARLLEYHNNL